MMKFRDFIEAAKDRFLDPETNKSWRAKDWLRQLKAIVDNEVEKGIDVNKIWVTFSEVTKLGQKMKVDPVQEEPVGIFAFPARYVLEDRHTYGYESRPYVHVFRTKSSHFEVGFDGNMEDILRQYSKTRDYNVILDAIPMGDVLRQYPNIELAISRAMFSLPKTKNQFLYSVVKQLAILKKGDWRVNCNKILRNLGINSIADTKHSGFVHPGEPTQGVFMNPKDIIPIDIIVKVPYSDKNDQASRPGKSWAIVQELQTIINREIRDNETNINKIWLAPLQTQKIDAPVLAFPVSHAPNTYNQPYVHIFKTKYFGWKSRIINPEDITPIDILINKSNWAGNQHRRTVEREDLQNQRKQSSLEAYGSTSEERAFDGMDHRIVDLMNKKISPQALVTTLIKIAKTYNKLIARGAKDTSEYQSVMRMAVKILEKYKNLTKLVNTLKSLI